MATTEKECYIEIDSMKIYTCSKGESPDTIVFIHGSSLSSKMWDKQITDPHLLEKFRLIVFDLPGHGKSSHSKNPQQDYSLKGLASVAAKLMNELNLENFIIVGASLGTNIIADSILLYNNNNCKGIALAGPSVANVNVPPPSVLIPSPYLHVFASASPAEDELAGYLNAVSEDAKIRKNYQDDFKKTDPIFRSVMGQSVADGEWTKEIDNLNKSNLPICVIMGAEEKIVQPDYLDNVHLKKWKNKVIKIAGAGHLVNLEKPETFNKILLDFAEEVFNNHPASHA
jgi:pimeloyl-ACP methyl ester carboxylesterase